jgi:hypothetical protein
MSSEKDTKRELTDDEIARVAGGVATTPTPTSTNPVTKQSGPTSSGGMPAGSGPHESPPPPPTHP